MALLSYGAELEKVRAAIDAVNSSQEYQIGSMAGGRRLRRADLESLLEREKFLIEKIEAFGADAIPGSTIMRQKVSVGFK